MTARVADLASLLGGLPLWVQAGVIGAIALVTAAALYGGLQRARSGEPVQPAAR